jgi:RNA polymerase sigma-70 factor (ECF subfamily)
VTQEVFLKLWKNLPHIETRKMKAWIMRVAHNASIDLIRKRSSRHHREYDDTLKIESESAITHGMAATDPETLLELDEKHRNLMQAMEGLSERVKSMLLLHYFEGFKYEEIAEILGLKLNAVKVAVHRGRKSLRDALKNVYPEREGKLTDECAVR